VDYFFLDKLKEIYEKEYAFDVSSYISRDLALLQCVGCGVQIWDPLVESPKELYEALSQQSWYYPDGKWEYDLCANWPKIGEKVLEVGCGAGHFRNRQQGTYTGLEFNPKVVDNEFIFSETIELHSQRRAQYYDWAFSFQVLEHAADPRGFLQGLRGSVKRGGHIVLGLPNDDSYLGRAKYFGLNLPPHHLTRWSVRSVVYLAQLFDLKLSAIHFSPYDPSAYQTKFVKDIDTTKGDLMVVDFIVA